jgi:hypothetical protein
MPCPNYKKLQQECETHRRQLGEFHLKKIPNWQRDEKTLWLVRGKQKAILEAQEIDGLAIDQLRRMLAVSITANEVVLWGSRSRSPVWKLSRLGTALPAALERE